MIKARTSTGDVFFGLSHENIRRLRAGQGLSTDCFSIKVNCRVVITVLSVRSPVITYNADGPRPTLLVVLPERHLQQVADADMAVFEARCIGAPFDLYVHVGETEQSIIDKLGQAAPVEVVHETVASARVH